MLTDGADWVRLQAKKKALWANSFPCCGEVSFSQQREKTFLEVADVVLLPCTSSEYFSSWLCKWYEFCVMALCQFLFSFDRANQTTLI